MFTGIIECTGEVQSREIRSGSVRLTLRGALSGEPIQVGESIAVNGCCLTVVEVGKETLAFDLLEETERRTSFGELKPGTRVNLERALRPMDRMGGHFVSGHLDGTSKILKWEQKGRDYELEISLKPEHRRWVMPKGSIALDGISLTVGLVTENSVLVWIIPHTREVTNLRDRVVGDGIHVEYDLLAKYAVQGRSLDC